MSVRFCPARRLSFGFLVALAPAGSAEPEVLDDRFELTLFAEHPAVRTPVGCTITEDGRLLVIESHTHFRPEGYEGPETDRILEFTDEDGDGKAEGPRVFYEGGKHTMSIAYDARLQTCYVATRARISALATNGTAEGIGEAREVVRLQTTGDYPHNGLCGLAFIDQGRETVGYIPKELDEPARDPLRPRYGSPTLLFGLGENLGHPYTLIAADGSTLEGGGEGGNIYRINGDGTGLERIATGFWNPFGICVTGGQIFAVDNDPDSRPPNRLLHIIEGGDYGYQFRYGRPGTHPLQGWDGDFPGTLPMLAGTGEAACSVIPYDGELLVTSWGHHRIERFQLKPRGRSYTATMSTLVRGGDDFRPVGIAEDGDGSLYFTDWVDKSYPLHGEGRIWKLRRKVPKPAFNPLPITPPEAAPPVDQRLDDPDPFVRAGGVWEASHAESFAPDWRGASPDGRVAILAVLRARAEGDPAEVLARALRDPSPEVRLAAVRWVSDEKLEQLVPALRELVPEAAGHARLFDAAVLTLKRLGEDVEGVDREALLLAVARDGSEPTAERIAALKRIPPASGALPVETFRELLADGDADFRAAAVWHLAMRGRDDAKTLLEKLASDAGEDGEIRADAALGLGRGPGLELHEPRGAQAWDRAVRAAGEGDPRAGRRIFFAEGGALCARCHTCGGYGVPVGPDLTGIGARMPRLALLESIVTPSKEIGPTFGAVQIDRHDGSSEVGIPMEVTGRHGTGAVSLLGVGGAVAEVALADIAAQRAWPVSLMPVGLDLRLSVEQMRDLLAFLGEEG